MRLQEIADDRRCWRGLRVSNTAFLGGRKLRAVLLKFIGAVMAAAAFAGMLTWLSASVCVLMLFASGRSTSGLTLTCGDARELVGTPYFER